MREGGNGPFISLLRQEAVLHRFDAQIKSYCFGLTGVETENVDRQFIHWYMKNTVLYNKPSPFTAMLDNTFLDLGQKNGIVR